VLARNTLVLCDCILKKSPAMDKIQAKASVQKPVPFFPRSKATKSLFSSVDRDGNPCCSFSSGLPSTLCCSCLSTTCCFVLLKHAFPCPFPSPIPTPLSHSGIISSSQIEAKLWSNASYNRLLKTSCIISIDKARHCLPGHKRTIVKIASGFL